VLAIAFYLFNFLSSQSLPFIINFYIFILYPIYVILILLILLSYTYYRLQDQTTTQLKLQKDMISEKGLISYKCNKTILYIAISFMFVLLAYPLTLEEVELNPIVSLFFL
jgi:hypothetical protein